MDYIAFIRDRIQQLRLSQGISERELSLRLGKGESYIQHISSARNLPALTALLEICDYFEITPAEFFDPELKNPNLVKKAMKEIQSLPEEDICFLIDVAKRII